ncbi:efflux RND transporter periplasmic adaptor subunit [Tenacibaculum finnmarkense]|uniref:efflux RND transporter periplasmic adaptor subunit n=1 Tax=Tenacibaculum finnmarkense TaxID=2781243 RepID=UPI001E524561|nr:efflux RND transporter periplasmic adaptor subunit [Tenacibaculum finnmarkense]MCD8399963.1 efflux RND transporter periplasmic adaptor subunit [Tenacibaculum finnmarkense genomovar ulcerans]MCG8785430.1 efflux RND transporter periplasmic adaptor subunit [Tenacibaculum finnmarkense]MCG8795442.1 efflux RND transporter periplasmic adaptor subunit [Tenacibaculum finnmarkense]MCG8797780.1 efflux RND transporter periplasmic adaptor subunit [Tenacibaculum finnmarkense]MCG8812785.1 efflux RND trans
MKKYIIYIGILTVGLLLGWSLFGNSPKGKTSHNHSEKEAVNKMWTCSMHPKIMQPEAGDCPICGMDLIPAETTSEGLNPNEFKLTKNAMALANIQTLVVGDNINTNATLKLSGKITESEDEKIVQASYFSGRIERLNISSVGEEVKKGQLLATIYSPELFAAQQELITASSLKTSQPALYNAVRNKLKLWKISKNQINQIEKLGKVKQNFPIYATVSGTVSEKLVAQGDYIKQGQALLKITNLTTVWALFDVYENQIDLFKKGQNITVTTNAYPNKKLKKKVNFIDPTFNSATRTLKLRVILDNKKREFKTGMFVEGAIENSFSDKKQLLMIPVSAILWTGKRSVVYIKTTPDQPIFEMREITIGKQLGNKYEVIDGLVNGDEIVTNGTFTIDASAQLHGKKSMMNRNTVKNTGTTEVISNHKNHLEKEIKNTLKNERIKVSKVFQEQLKIVVNDYINLKNYLINEDEKNVVIASKNILNNLKNVDMKLLKNNNAHLKWMSFDKKIKNAVYAISKETAIKEQRNHFKELSLVFINTVETFGINEKMYRQFCPMADDYKGGYWLSKEEKVQNPYFGNKMLKCGSVKQVIE